jgi:acetyl-CoA synthetase
MTDNARLVQSEAELERVLEELQQVERFEPSPEFRERAQVRDPGVDTTAEHDPQGYWANQPASSTGTSRPEPCWTTPTRRSTGGSRRDAQRLLQLSRPARPSRTRRPGRLPLGGEEGEERDITYADLHRDVQRLANGLKDLGVGRGDVVGIFLPMIPEVIVAMLACARIGAPHNVVFGGFSPDSVYERMKVSHAKALITVDGARRKGRTAAIKRELDWVISGLEDLRTVVVVRHTGTDCPMQDGRDVYYDELLATSQPVCPAEPLPAEHPLFILYSSGSTAKPKGIVHTAKIMRRLLRDIAEGRELGDVTTLRDPAVVEQLQQQAAARATAS